MVNFTTCITGTTGYYLRLWFQFKPELVCHFIAGFYKHELNFNAENALEFYQIAQCFGCIEISKEVKDFVNSNMTNEILIDAWTHGEIFQKECLEFIENSSDFDPNYLFKEVKKLVLDDFVNLMNLIRGFESCDLVKLYLKWISGQNDIKQRWQRNEPKRRSNDVFCVSFGTAFQNPETSF